ncbi:MAG: AAA family ATPase [Candidatus Omnitrophota bacterium]|nr:AAA family ATPase [Candidatus Omnitrophota bacterium]
MYFKRLEMLGFKSFCDKTVLNFEPGITAVVGPNGCGKSNIFDAIRWVLGEQSVRAMRGNSMEDVIFNGTDNKSALGFAEVSLTFSNETKILPIEYDEVTVTRRLFRSGESEYLLNKNVVRLKDILELFMGTGIGSESYSLIEQGKVDLIISSKPEDRRVIFDEAAGITKYKSKKREALNKLADTENNLLRINDIIIEVKRQIGSIERQANKARRYKEEFDKLKSMELSMAKYDLERLSKEKGGLSSRIQELKDKEIAFASESEGAKAKLAGENEQLKALEQKVNEINSQIIRIDSAIEMNNRHMDLNRERINEVKARSERLEEQKQVLTRVCEEQQKKIDNFMQEMENLIETVNKNSSLLQEKRDTIEEVAQLIKKAQDEVTQAKKSILEVSSDQSKVKNELTQIFAQAQGLLARKRRLDLEKLKVTSEKEQVDNNLKSINFEIAASQDKLKDLNGQKINLNLEAENLKRQSVSLKEKISRMESEVVRLQSQKEFLEDLRLQYQDMPDAMNAILLAVEPPNGSIAGILGKVKEVQPLSEGNKDLARQHFKNINLSTLRQIVCETKYVDMDPQKIIAKIEQVSQQVKELKDEEVNLAKAVEDKTNQAAKLDEEVHQEEMVLSNKQTQKDSIAEEDNKLLAELELLESELKETSEGLNNLAAKEEILKKTSAALEERFKQTEEMINENQGLISLKSLEREGASVAVAQLETELSSLKDKERAAGDTLRMLENSLGRERENLENLLRENEESQNKVKAWEEEIVALGEQNKKQEQSEEEFREGLKDYSREEGESLKTISIWETKVKEIEGNVNEIRNSHYTVQMQEQEINYKEQGIRERVSQAYKVNLNEVQSTITEETNVEELASISSKLKEKLEAYGTVNLVAIEEFDELKQRFEFLTQQQNDLLTAKESLHNTILKINRTTRQLFTETFDKVAEEFKNYFRALFGGGEAQLILIDPEDVLESGIEIVARPPGKKLQNISLLSGGEKSLTAIALIFSVFKVRPSPFCILDEIDAALDESNVGRFSYMLKDFTHSSQFIVITHNKKTIVNADVMYGITMQETGVSKIVSVKFAERPKETREPEVAVAA